MFIFGILSICYVWLLRLLRLYYNLYLKFRCSRPEVFCEKDILRNFAKFTGKHLCQRFFFNKVVGFRLATLLKNSLWHRCFPVNFVKFLRTPFLKKHLRWLLLEILKNSVVAFGWQLFANFHQILNKCYCLRFLIDLFSWTIISSGPQKSKVKTNVEGP